MKMSNLVRFRKKKRKENFNSPKIIIFLNREFEVEIIKKYIFPKLFRKKKKILPIQKC